MKFIATLSLLLSGLALYAQSNFTLSGKITDEQGNGIDLVLVSIAVAEDSLPLKVQYTDQDGSFEISRVPPGNYTLKTQVLGYSSTIIPVKAEGVNARLELPVIVLSAITQTLQEVTVTAKTPYIERKIDRTIVNVDALLANAGSSALEALERAPGVAVDQSGGIRLKGRPGVVIFMDDKPTYLSGTDLENYLRSLPSSAIQRIEIMPNPPAKYEAAGNSGVINIVTKKNKTSGFHGNLSLSLQQGRYTRSNNSVNLNWNRKKVSLYANINGGIRNSFQDLNINRFYKTSEQVLNSTFSQNSFIEKTGQSGNLKVGIDYYPTGKSTIGFSFKGLVNPNGDHTQNTARITDGNFALVNRVLADNQTDVSFSNGTFNGYWKQLLDDKGSAVTLDADYVTYDSDAEQVFKNFIYTSDNQLTYQDQINGALPASINIYAVKADLSKPLNGTSGFEAGLKSAFTNTDNEAIYTNTLNGITTPDYNLSNRFQYEEWIHAAYVNYNKTFGKIGIQAGLRAETTRLNGHQLGNPVQPDSMFTRTYHNLFPTFFANWQMDSAGLHQMNVSFGRRINRPFFQDLNPFIRPLDKFTFYGGNPNLLPTYANNYSLTYSYKNQYNFTLSYAKTTDGINETLEINNGIYYSRPGNIATNEHFALSIDAAIQVTPWYRINAYGELGHQIFKSALYTEQLDAQGTYYVLSATNSFDLGKGWNADIRGDLQSDIVYAQLLIKGFGIVNTAIQKKILKDKGSLKLTLGDIFYTRIADGVINNLKDTEANWNSRLDTRSATVAFTYRFGKATSNKPKHNSTGSDTEQSRVKTG